MKNFVLAIVLLLLSNCTLINSQYSYAIEDDTYNEVKLNHKFFTVPAGAKFRAVVTSPINSETSFAGQLVSLVLHTDFYYNSDKIAPVGSIITGSVTDVSKAKHGSLNGKMTLRFTSIMTPEGEEIPISAIVKTRHNTGILMGGETYALNMSDNSIPSAIPVNAVSTLSISKDASVSRTAGNGGGLVKSIWDKGEEVIIPANALLDLILTQPITVKTKFSENQ